MANDATPSPGATPSPAELRSALIALGFRPDLLSVGGAAWSSALFATCETCGAAVHVIPGETDGSQQPINQHKVWHDGDTEWNRNAVNAPSAASTAREELRTLIREWEFKHGPIAKEDVLKATGLWPDRCRCGEPFTRITPSGVGIHNGCQWGEK